MVEYITTQKGLSQQYEQNRFINGLVWVWYKQTQTGILNKNVRNEGDNMTLGERIKKARKGKYSQAELAELINVHENTLRRWELGERIPDANVIPKLAQYLGVSVSYLMGEESGDDIPPENGFLSIRKMPAPSTRSSKWMLVYERDGERIELPPTEQGYEIINNIASAIVNRPALNVVAHSAVAVG